MPRRRHAVGADPLAGIDPERLAMLLGESDAPRRGHPRDAAVASDPAASLQHSAFEAPVASNRSSEETSPRDDLLEDRGKLLHAADRHAGRGDHRGAAELLVRALERAPDDVEIAIRLGRAYGRLTAHDDAESVLQRALRIEPRNAEARCELGILLAKRGLYAAATEELRRALDLDPRLARGYYHLGVCYNQLDRLDEAVAALERAVALHPEDDRAHYQMGIVYDRKSMSEDARSMYRRAREITDARASRG